MATIHQFTNSPARAPARTRSPSAPVTSVPAIPADRLRAIFDTHVVDDRPDLFACLDTPAPHRGFAVLIGAACSWLAVFVVAYFAAQMLRVWL